MRINLLSSNVDYFTCNVSRISLPTITCQVTTSHDVSSAGYGPAAAKGNAAFRACSQRRPLAWVSILAVAIRQPGRLGPRNPLRSIVIVAFIVPRQRVALELVDDSCPQVCSSARKGQTRGI